MSRRTGSHIELACAPISCWTEKDGEPAVRASVCPLQREHGNKSRRHCPRCHAQRFVSRQPWPKKARHRRCPLQSTLLQPVSTAAIFNKDSTHSIPDKRTRDKAVKSLASFLSAKNDIQLPKTEIAKLWKGIFYCAFMCYAYEWTLFLSQLPRLLDVGQAPCSTGSGC